MLLEAKDPSLPRHAPITRQQQNDAWRRINRFKFEYHLDAEFLFTFFAHVELKSVPF